MGVQFVTMKGSGVLIKTCGHNAKKVVRKGGKEAQAHTSKKREEKARSVVTRLTVNPRGVWKKQTQTLTPNDSISGK